MLVELSVVEQRCHAVMEAVADAPATEGAGRYGGVSQAGACVAGSVLRGRSDLSGLADRSYRPRSHIRGGWMRRSGRGWFSCGLRIRDGVRGGLPTSCSVKASRLCRDGRGPTAHWCGHGRVAARARKRRLADYTRWERPTPMQLWQMDVMGSVRLVVGNEAKLQRPRSSNPAGQTGLVRCADREVIPRVPHQLRSRLSHPDASEPPHGSGLSADTLQWRDLFQYDLL